MSRLVGHLLSPSNGSCVASLCQSPQASESKMKALGDPGVWEGVTMRGPRENLGYVSGYCAAGTVPGTGEKQEDDMPLPSRLAAGLGSAFFDFCIFLVN